MYDFDNSTITPDMIDTITGMRHLYWVSSCGWLAERSECVLCMLFKI